VHKEIQRIVTASKARKLAHSVCSIKPVNNGPQTDFALTYFPQVGGYIVRNPGDPVDGFALANNAFAAAIKFRQSCLDWLAQQEEQNNDRR